jgi:Family of unknown function (DUF6064)
MLPGGSRASLHPAVWPAPAVAYLLGLVIVVAVVRRRAASDFIAGGGLAAMWIWTGVVYHWLFFARINRAALVFGALFVLQGALLVHAALIQRSLVLGASEGRMRWLGWGLLAYASLGYPLVGVWTGHRYPSAPMFGLTPCPVTLFTLGLFLLSARPVPRRLLIVPLAWSLVGGSAAFFLRIPQDWLLLVSGLAVPFIVRRDASPPAAAANA